MPGHTPEILNSECNRAAAEQMIDAIKQPLSLVPFVGAGLSVPWGYPTWPGFLQSAAEKTPNFVDIQREIARGEYILATDHIEGALGKDGFNELVTETFGLDKLRRPSNPTAVQTLTKFVHGPVITTNFDSVLSLNFREAGNPFVLELWAGKPWLGTDVLLEDLHCLLKLHGDAADYHDRVLTPSEYKKHYGDSTQPLPRLLKNVFSSRPVLFTGCRLKEDWYLQILEGLSPAPQHFAIVEFPGESVRDQREAELRSHAIMPIWYPIGQHDHVLEILKYAATQATPRDATPVYCLIRSELTWLRPHRQFQLSGRNSETCSSSGLL